MSEAPPPAASTDQDAGTSTAPTDTGSEQVSVQSTPQRVGWLELFYDLVFVVVVAQLSGHLEGDPGRRDVLVTLGLFIVVWTAWFNCVALTNLSHGLATSSRAWVLASMAGVGVMAVGVSPHTHRVAIFALGYALARLALTPLWMQQRRDNGLDPHRAVLFGVGISAGWIASIWVPHGWQTGVWALLLVLESFLSMYRPARGERFVFNSSHMLERIGAFVLICFGEAVARLVGSVDADPVAATWWCAGLGFLLLASLFWLFYDMAFARVEHALEDRPDRLGDVLGSGQFLVVNGLIGFAAGVASAIEAAAAHHHLSHGALWVLCGGVSAVTLGVNSLSMDAFKIELGLFRPARGERQEQRLREQELWQQHDQLLQERLQAQGATRDAGSTATMSQSTLRRRRRIAQTQRLVGQMLQCLGAPLLVALLGDHWPPAVVVGALAVMPVVTGLSVTLFRRRRVGAAEAADAEQTAFQSRRETSTT